LVRRIEVAAWLAAASLACGGAYGQDDNSSSGAERDPEPSAADSAELASATYFGEFTAGGAGFTLAETPHGNMNFSAWGYVRYLNQKNLDETYTDSFGRTKTLDLRNDLQLNKVNLYFKGWIYNPKFTYLFFVWTQNASQGEGAQVVVGGALEYRAINAFNVGAGVTQLPGTRSLRGTFPYWNRVDTRVIADEFFRPSYTQGVYLFGQFDNGVQYKVTVGNNLSALGVSATQLDGNFNTVSGALTWAPKGEYGPRRGWVDFEEHDTPVSQFGIAVTRSREDAQSQPGTDTIENSQIRLSDGTLLFSPGAFNTAGQVKRASYLMASIDAGWKYKGFEIAGDYYNRKVDRFETVGLVPVTQLNDWGVQMQISKMVIPSKLGVYIGMSKIYGEYGEPHDTVIGTNLYLFQRRLLRLNTEFMYLKNSPVGYPSVPFLLGGNGTVFSTSLEMVF
jgi:hypothetical protein